MQPFRRHKCLVVRLDFPIQLLQLSDDVLADIVSLGLRVDLLVRLYTVC
jgi:hypothetical protein